jgi:NAD(P)H-dependent FMN reductase
LTLAKVFFGKHSPQLIFYAITNQESSITMTYTPKILAFSGSTRTNSFNKKLVKIAGNAAKNAGAEVTFIDLRDYPMPLYDEDLEAAQGMPINARRLKELFNEHQGLLISSPEYNGAYPGVLKNAIDWVSRPFSSDEIMHFSFLGKVGAIMSASPGAMGGVRALAALRLLLENIQIMVIPSQKGISNAYAAFNEDGTLKDEKLQDAIEKLGQTVAEMLIKLNG